MRTAIGWVLAAAAMAAPVELAKNGKSRFAISLPADAIPSERRAAEELRRFVREMSRAELPIVGDATPRRHRATIVHDATLGPEEYEIRADGNEIRISGGRPRGALYGVYGLLDRLGCRWYTAGVSRIPKLGTLVVPEMRERRKPAFEYREAFFTEAWDKDWSARNRLNGQNHKLDDETGGRIQYFPFVHSFLDLIPPKEHFEAHPEYFSLIDGKRRHERGQLCLTNAAVKRLAVERVRQWIREHPEAKIFSVSQNDWTGWCECDACRRVEEEEGGVHSGPLLRFVNDVAEEIGKTHPDKLIDTLAYWYTERPPTKVRPLPNVRIRLCPIGACEAHPLASCPYNRFFLDLLKAWSGITKQLYVWHYNTNFSHYLLPFPDFDELAADIPQYHRNGVVGLFLQGAYAPGGGGENAELRSYVMARMLWDPSLDVQREIADFHQAYFGPAAAHMRAYFDLMHEQVRPEGKGKHLWIFVHPRVPHLSGDFLDKATGLLHRAEFAAGSPEVLRRVKKARLPLEYVRLRRAQQYEVRDGFYAPRGGDGLAARFQAFFAEARGFGIRNLHESQPIEQDEQMLPNGLRQYRAVTLASGPARAVLIPALSARVVEFAKSGVNALRVADAGSWRYPDVSGIWAQIHPDRNSAAPYEFHWDEAEMDGAAALVRGVSLAGFHATRRIQLRDGILETTTEVENVSDKPWPAVIQHRADYSPNDDLTGEGLALSYASIGGARIDRLLFEPGAETSGNATFDGDARPAGEWRAYHRSPVFALTGLFDPAETPRLQMSWSLRGASLITLAAWSREAVLPPRGKLTFSSRYRLD